MLQTQAKSPQIDVFTELDPLGTGLIKPYVDKKDFFQHLKNPPKKVLKDLVSTNSADTFPTNFNVLSEPLESVKPRNDVAAKENQFEDSNFANFDRFDENEAIQSVFARTDSCRRTDITPRPAHHQPLSVSLPPEDTSTPKSSTIPTSAGVSLLTRMEKDSTESIHGLVKLPSPIKSTRKKEFDVDISGNKAQSVDKTFPVDFSATNESPASPLKSCSSDANSRLSSSSTELELVPEPPPRGIANILINPPPLPPKKQGVRGMIKPPPRPPHTETYFHYDFPERESEVTKDRSKSPLKEAKSLQSDDNFSPPVQMSNKSDLISAMTTSTFEDSFSSMVPTTNLSTFFTSTSATTGPKRTKPSLDITLSQLTSANLDELANSLGMTVKELTSLTLQQLTECLATLSAKEAASSDTEEPVSMKQEPATVVQPQSMASGTVHSRPTFNEPQPFTKNFEQETKQDTTYDKYAVFRELFELEQMEKNEESTTKESTEEEASSSVKKEEFEIVSQQHETSEESRSDTLATLVNLTVKLPPSNEDLTKEEPNAKPDEKTESSNMVFEKTQSTESESKAEPAIESEVSTDLLSKQPEEEESDKTKPIVEIEEKMEETESEKPSDSNEDSDKPVTEKATEETNGSVDKVEVKPSASISSDKYAALREIIGEPEPPIVKPTEEDTPTSTRMSPVVQLPAQSKPSAEVELLNLFSDTPPPSSPKKQPKKEEKTGMSMDIFEEIKMLSTSGQPTKTKSLIPEDIFCPFTELKPERDESKDDGNWTKFDTGLFVSDRPPSECPPSISGTSPWSPDGKEFHRESSFKGSVYQQSGDSDNEWKDEEESEESNGRIRDPRFRCSHYPRFDGPFGDRGFYEETGGSKRDRGFRDRMMEDRKSRDSAWIKNTGHRPRDSSPWHDEGQWEKESKHYPHRKMQYKDEDEHYEAHWKCRSKPQRWNWPHEHGPSFYDDERKRKMMLWKEDRFGSQESMGYDDDDRWSRRKYERRRWPEEDARFWNRRTAGPPDSDYPSRDYYYYREARDRSHDYPSAWNEDYGSDRPGDDSPRYNQSGRKRHWPKRPNSANEGRNIDMIYGESRSKFGTSRSECNDNDSDPYVRSSQRSRSRQSYWGSDQEYDSWVERPYWSEEPDTKSENLHRKRVVRHKPRQPHVKTQSPFEDDFAQSVEHIDPSATESLTPVEPPRIRSEGGDQKPSPQSPSFSTRYSKVARRGMDEVYSKRSSYFEDDLPFTATTMSDSSDRQRLPSDQKQTPEDVPSCEAKDAPPDDFVSGDGGRDSFFNGHLRYDDDAFAFKAEMEDNVSDHRATTLPLKNHNRQGKYSAGGNNNNNNNKARNDQHIRKSESVNIFVRESDPFGDDDFFD